MKYFVAVSAVLPLVSAAVLQNQAREVSHKVKIVLQLNTISSEASVGVWIANRTAAIAYACGTALTLGAFDKHHISFEVDANGVGNLSVDSDSYLIHEDPAYSGGISCNRIYSATETMVTCSVTLPAGLQFRPLDHHDLPKCFSTSSFNLDRILAGFESEVPEQFTAMETTRMTPQKHPDAMYKRQGACGTWSHKTRLVGDGSPHQNPYNIQLSENMECDPQHDCAIGPDAATSFTVKSSASAPLTMWISGGFAVEQSIKTGNEYTCSGRPGDYFCLWKKQAQTAYTVQNEDYNVCTGSELHSPFILWSPNIDDVGGNYYCVYGRQYCRSIGQGWLDTSGPAGGPGGK